MPISVKRLAQTSMLVIFLALTGFIVFAPRHKAERTIESPSNQKPPGEQEARQKLSRLPNSPPKDEQPADPESLEVILGLDVTESSQRPLIAVRTNLPAQTNLIAYLVSPTNQGGDGYSGEAKSSVGDDHIAKFGPFSKDGRPLSSGVYRFTVNSVGVDFQPKEVRALFGADGRNLEGVNVSILPGTLERLVSQKYQFSLNSDGSITEISVVE